jgi:hypothetical protein
MDTVLYRVLSFLDRQYIATGDEVVARLHNDLEKVVRTLQQQGTEADEARLQAAAEAATCAARTAPPGTRMAAWRVKPVVEALRPYIAPPRPEPPKELVRKWELEAEKWAASRFLENPLSARIGYVAALRAAWEADPKGKQ